jgi:hypothetical protein
MSAFFAVAAVAGAAVIVSKAAENIRQIEEDGDDRRSHTRGSFSSSMKGLRG